MMTHGHYGRSAADTLGAEERAVNLNPAMTCAYAATRGTMADEIQEVYRALPCANSHPSYDGNRPEQTRLAALIQLKIIEACMTC